MARYHRVEDIIHLALALQVPGRGLCLEDIQQRFEVGRRTAERMREAVDRLYPGMTATKGGDSRKYWSLPVGDASGLVTWLPEELDALGRAIEEADAAGDPERAEVLASLHDKVEILTTNSDGHDSRSLRGGPMEWVRRAIVLERELALEYQNPSGEITRNHVEPYGLLGGSRPILVAKAVGQHRPRLYSIEEIVKIDMLESTFQRDPKVDIRRYAANAFSHFDEGPIRLSWRFAAKAADEARAYEFHPEQEFVSQPGGSVEVRFRAESLVEMAWHLFAWGDRVETLEPLILKHRFNAMLHRAIDTRTESSEALSVPPEQKAH